MQMCACLCVCVSSYCVVCIVRFKVHALHLLPPYVCVSVCASEQQLKLHIK